MQATEQWIGYQAVGNDGKQLGEITGILNDDETGKPEWAVVSVGFLGGEKPVPLAGAQQRDNQIQFNVSKDQVKGAPSVGDTNHLTPEEEETLFKHYGVPYGGDTVTSMGGPNQTAKGGQDYGERMPLHEEELVARKQTVQRGEARVGKQVVTEQKHVEVPVTREEPYIERQPVARRPAESEIGQGEIKVPVMAEQAQADKRTVVNEEVKVGKRPVTETQQVSDTVRREEPAIDGETITEPTDPSAS